MKISLFHGTTPQVAKQLLAGKVDVSLGGGEFGRGFYLGTSRRLAKRRAFHKTENRLGTPQDAMRCNYKNTYMLVLDIPAFKHSHSIDNLDRAMSIGLYDEIKKRRIYRSYTSGSDAIVGVIVGTGRYFDVTQYKFESWKAEQTLNAPNGHIKIGAALI